MKNQIRMKDGRDEEGTGYITVEEAWYSKDGEMMGWTTLTETWYYQGKASHFNIKCDNISTVHIQQFTKQRHVWAKKQMKNEVHDFLTNPNYNFTVLERQEKKLKVDKCDC